MIWSCLPWIGSGAPRIIRGTLDSTMHDKEQENNMILPVTFPKLLSNWIFQQDNDTSGSRQIKILVWPSQSSHLNYRKSVGDYS